MIFFFFIIYLPWECTGREWKRYTSITYTGSRCRILLYYIDVAMTLAEKDVDIKYCAAAKAIGIAKEKKNKIKNTSTQHKQ